MISEATHKELIRRWSGRIYATRERIAERLEHLEGLLPMLVNKRVLELGCNAGLHAIEICKYAASYIGVEPDKYYAKQASITFEVCKPRARTHVICGYVGDVPPQFEPEAVVICVALYLLNATDLDTLGTLMLHMDTVIIQERRAHRDRPDNPTNGLHTPKAIAKWLSERGFTPHVYYSKHERFFEVVGHRC